MLISFFRLWISLHLVHWRSLRTPMFVDIRGPRYFVFLPSEIKFWLLTRVTSLLSVQKFPLPSLIQTIPVTIITKKVLEHLAHPWSDTLNFTLILRKVTWDGIQAVSWPRGIEKRFYCTSRLPISPVATNIQIKIPTKCRYKCVSFHCLPWPSIPIVASREVVHEPNPKLKRRETPVLSGR